MSKWLLYDTHQQRFITSMSPLTMKRYLHPFNTKAEAITQIEEMGTPAFIMPIETVSVRQVLKGLDHGTMKLRMIVTERDLKQNVFHAEGASI